MTRSSRFLVACLACAAVAHAVPVEKWVQTTHSDFGNGKAEGTAILSLGQVELAPELKAVLDKPVSHIWALAADAKGTVYAATGVEAKVLRIQGAKVDTLFTSPNKADLEVFAVAVGPKGAVYAATAPSGSLFRIGADGKHTLLYKSDDPYIWSLAVAPDGSVLAGTGPNGKLLKISPKGKASVLVKTNADHVLSVLLAPDGSIYAGTDKNGFLYHVDAKGKARVVYDAPESEIRALALDPKGRLHFATAATSGGAPSTPSPSSSPGRTIVMSGGRPTMMPSRPSSTPSPSPSKPSAPGAKLSATNSIYRLDTDGDVTKILSLKGVAFYALAWHNGHLYAATGNDGKLYRVNGDKAVQLADLDESQLMALAVAGKTLMAATANPGRIYRMAARHAAQGTFVSEVYDAGSRSRWGQIAWQADAPKGTTVTLAVRTGNAARPDDSWTAWSAELKAPGQPIPWPAARYVQYRATLKTKSADVTATLDEVVIAYVQTNRPPEVASITIGEIPKPRQPSARPQPGVPAPPTPAPKSRPLTTKKQPATSPRGPFPDGIRIAWSASDPNKDDLRYEVYFRAEDETAWKRLGERLDANYLDWDSHNVPDGAYRVRVVASDAASNPPAQALTGERITEAFYIDNTPPTVGALAVKVGADRKAVVSAKCTDKGSTLASAEYSVDAGDWVTVPAADGIFDSAAETIAFTTEALDKGEHTIVVRAKDDADNSGAAKAVFTVK